MNNGTVFNRDESTSGLGLRKVLHMRNGPPTPVMVNDDRLMDEEAWRFYSTPAPGRFSYSLFLSPAELRPLRTVLGRPMTLEEIRALVREGPDGFTQCAATGRQFKPVEWIEITDDLVETVKRLELSIPRATQSIRDRGQIRLRGCFYAVAGRILGYSGSLWKYKKGVGCLPAWKIGAPVVESWLAFAAWNLSEENDLRKGMPWSDADVQAVEQLKKLTPNDRRRLVLRHQLRLPIKAGVPTST